MLSRSSNTTKENTGSTLKLCTRNCVESDRTEQSSEYNLRLMCSGAGAFAPVPSKHGFINFKLCKATNTPAIRQVCQVCTAQTLKQIVKLLPFFFSSTHIRTRRQRQMGPQHQLQIGKSWASAFLRSAKNWEGNWKGNPTSTTNKDPSSVVQAAVLATAAKQRLCLGSSAHQKPSLFLLFIQLQSFSSNSSSSSKNYSSTTQELTAERE